MRRTTSSSARKVVGLGFLPGEARHGFLIDIPNALRNWEALDPEERWWLYTMTVATTGQAMQKGLGWRKARQGNLPHDSHDGRRRSVAALQRRNWLIGLPADRERAGGTRSGAGQGSAQMPGRPVSAGQHAGCLGVVQDDLPGRIPFHLASEHH
jgi:hypothetical protein